MVLTDDKSLRRVLGAISGVSSRCETKNLYIWLWRSEFWFWEFHQAFLWSLVVRTNLFDLFRFWKFHGKAGIVCVVPRATTSIHYDARVYYNSTKNSQNSSLNSLRRRILVAIRGYIPNSDYCSTYSCDQLINEGLKRYCDKTVLWFATFMMRFMVVRGYRSWFFAVTCTAGGSLSDFHTSAPTSHSIYI